MFFKKNMNFHDGNISKSSQPEVFPDGPRLHIAGWHRHSDGPLGPGTGQHQIRQRGTLAAADWRHRGTWADGGGKVTTNIREATKMEGIAVTILLFNIAMENGPFIDDFPSKTSIYNGLSIAMLNSQMVNGLVQFQVGFHSPSRPSVAWTGR